MRTQETKLSGRGLRLFALSAIAGLYACGGSSSNNHAGAGGGGVGGTSGAAGAAGGSAGAAGGSSGGASGVAGGGAGRGGAAGGGSAGASGVAGGGAGRGGAAGGSAGRGGAGGAGGGAPTSCVPACTGVQVCVYPSCGTVCIPTITGAGCPTSQEICNGGCLQAVPCTTPAPFCADMPAACASGSTCSCVPSDFCQGHGQCEWADFNSQRYVRCLGG